jgi:hypothetical protein
MNSRNNSIVNSLPNTLLVLMLATEATKLLDRVSEDGGAEITDKEVAELSMFIHPAMMRQMKADGFPMEAFDLGEEGMSPEIVEKLNQFQSERMKNYEAKGEHKHESQEEIAEEVAEHNQEQLEHVEEVLEERQADAIEATAEEKPE